jgi:hypothetical protein
MSSFLKTHYGTTEGPLGFPLTDKQAFALEAVLKALPREDAFRYRKLVVGKGPTELLTGERSDVSWITTEDPDRVGDVVLARGMNDSQFRQNPIVTLNHAYFLPPVGKSLWRKYATDGAVKGIKAKTQYPGRPSDWPAQKDWPADLAFALVQADLLRGKSIGFLPTKVHTPNSDELKQNGWEKVGVVIDEWILLEYACVFLPANQNTVLESVSGKALPPIPEEFQKALGVTWGKDEGGRMKDEQGRALIHPSSFILHPSDEVPFTPLSVYQRAIDRSLAQIDPARIAEKIIQDRLDAMRGRV